MQVSFDWHNVSITQDYHPSFMTQEEGGGEGGVGGGVSSAVAVVHGILEKDKGLVSELSKMKNVCQEVRVFLDMGWLRLVGSIKLYVSIAKEPYKRDDIMQKRPKI